MKIVLTPDTKKEIRAALDAWHNTDSEGLLSGWLLAREALRKLTAHNNSIEIQRLATNNTLLNALDMLAEQSPKLAKTLQMRSLDNEVEQKVATALQVSIPTMYRYQRKAIEALTQILVAQEQALYARLTTAQRQTLPHPSYSNLFGITDLQDRLFEQLTSADALCFFLVCGLGGIGKTSLIRSLTDRVIETLCFDNIYWIEISHHGMTQTGKSNAVQQVIDRLTELSQQSSPSEQELRVWIQQQSALIIIDNVENLEDATEVYRRFNGWLTRSKLILTSRARPIGLQQTHVTTLNELSQTDSVTMIRHLATATGQTDLANATNEQLCSIFERTGGNPQAIKLVMGLAMTRPISVVLADLPVAQRGETVQLYQHIYRKAWHSLSDNSKRLFKFMPLVGARGTEPAHMQTIAKLSDEQFWQAVEELLTRSLLLQVGSTFTPRYGIHRLSEQFLKEQVLKW